MADMLQLLANLQGAKRPPIPVETVLSMKTRLPNIFNNANTIIIELIWREAQLHALWHEVKQNETPPISRYELQGLLKTALDLDVEYQNWEDMLPPNWGYWMESNNPETRSPHDVKWQKLVLEGRGAPEEIHVHPSLKKSWIWGFYRTSRMFLLRDTLELLNWMLRLPDSCSSAQHARTDSGRTFFTSSKDDGNVATMSLDKDLLHLQHTHATMRLVHMIEKACSAIFGNFIVPIPEKSFEDIMGMRAYMTLWPMGTMDSILKSGLVPDSCATRRRSKSGFCSTNMLPLTPETSQCASSPPQSFYHDTSMATVENGTYLPEALENAVQEYPSTPTSIRASPAPPTTFNSAAKTGHVFDSSPLHPYDSPAESADIEGSCSIDVGARREWLNSMLYYIGSELGIKKALAVPYVEGYLSTVKPRVDKILGR